MAGSRRKYSNERQRQQRQDSRERIRILVHRGNLTLAISGRAAAGLKPTAKRSAASRCWASMLMKCSRPVCGSEADGELGAGQTSILNGPVLTATVLPAVENTKCISMVYSPIGAIQPTFG